MTKTFNELIQSDKPVIVDFFAEWCGPCKSMAPILKDVKDNLGESATIIKIDVDKNPATSSQYQIQGVPTLIIFKQGKTVWRKSGVVSKNELLNTIRNFL